VREDEREDKKERMNEKEREREEMNKEEVHQVQEVNCIDTQDTCYD
jgi:hypothetical protein